MNETIKFFNLSDIAPRFSKNNFRVYSSYFAKRNAHQMNIVQKALIAAIVRKSFENEFSKRWLDSRRKMVMMSIQREQDEACREFLNFELGFYNGALNLL